MSLIGDSKEEDREIFDAFKQLAKERRKLRAQAAEELMDVVAQYVDNQTVRIDPNGTWNFKIGGSAGQYWPTKGRWQWTDPAIVVAAKRRAKAAGKEYYSISVKSQLYGGGISKFLQWLRKQHAKYGVQNVG